MIPVIRDIFYKILSEKPKTIKIFNEKILQRQVKFLCVALRYCNTLEVLNLRNNHLSPCGAVIISGVFKYTVHLTQLVLEDNHIKGEGMKVICENLHILSSLELLSLSQNTLGDSANELADALDYLSCLKDLHLGMMEITSNDFNILSPHLCGCNKLVRFDIGYNKLDLGSLTALYLILNSLTGLKECVISGIEISEADIDKLILAFSNTNIKV